MGAMGDIFQTFGIAAQGVGQESDARRAALLELARAGFIPRQGAQTQRDPGQGIMRLLSAFSPQFNQVDPTSFEPGPNHPEVAAQRRLMLELKGRDDLQKRNEQLQLQIERERDNSQMASDYAQQTHEEQMQTSAAQAARELEEFKQQQETARNTADNTTDETIAAGNQQVYDAAHKAVEEARSATDRIKAELAQVRAGSMGAQELIRLNKEADSIVADLDEHTGIEELTDWAKTMGYGEDYTRLQQSIAAKRETLKGIYKEIAAISGDPTDAKAARREKLLSEHAPMEGESDPYLGKDEGGAELRDESEEQTPAGRPKTSAEAKAFRKKSWNIDAQMRPRVDVR